MDITKEVIEEWLKIPSPLNEKVKRAVIEQIKRVNQDFPSGLMIDGCPGTGKTTLGVQITDYINACYGVKPMIIEEDLHQQLGSGLEEFKINFYRCILEELPSCIYDEAGEYSKRRALSLINFQLNRFFETARAYKKIIIMVMPTFLSLDSHLFTLGYIRCLFHAVERRKNSTLVKVFSIKRLKTVRMKARYLPQEFQEQAYKKVSPNFVFSFPDLPPERALKLRYIGINAKNLINSELGFSGENAL